MKEIVVLYPIMGRGHLIPMVELGKFMLSHHPSLSITILLPSPPDPSTADYIAAVPSSFTFHHLPAVNPPPNHISSRLLGNTNLRYALHSISPSSKLIKAFVLDFFNFSAAEVPSRLDIPTYYFFPTAASSLALFLYFPTIHRNTSGFHDAEYLPLSVPGLPPITAEDMPDPIRDRQSWRYEFFLHMSSYLRKNDGIIVNTFANLETRALKALTEGPCVPEGPTPPVFCVGPLVSISTRDGERDDNDCLSWLDSQPSRSVAFLSFGSQGRFSANQVKEIAVGLERSGVRFLWVVRDPSGKRERSLDELVPKGFLERTKGRGMVVKNWAPQMAILSHDSVGGFVSHCGWNSVLEAIWEGVPMVAWPLYAEQRLNRVVMVEEMKVALPLKMSEDGFVSATELENRVRELMESEKGKEVRERTLGVRNDAVAALRDGGSSWIALNRLTESWKKHNFISDTPRADSESSQVPN